MNVNNHSSGNTRNLVQAGNIGSLTVQESAGAGGPKSNQSAKALGWLAAIAAALFLIVPSCLADQANRAPVSFPEEHGQRPPGAKDDAVRAAVGDKLRLCAQAVVVKPENCPQSVAVEYSSSDVQWALHGDPTDGALLAWHDDRFFIRGAAIMTVSYSAVNTSHLQVQVVGFQAEVFWKEAGPVVEKIYPMNAASISAIRKHDPSLPPDQVAAAVRDAFNRCAASTVSPMPPECPAPSGSPFAQKVTWKLGGDPALNTRQTFDQVSGLTHVIGSYAATARYRDILNAQVSAPISGSYDALIISGADGLRVLQLRDT